MIVPQRVAFALFDDGIILTRIALFWGFHKARIGNYCLGAYLGVDRLKPTDVVGKDCFKHGRLSEDLLVFPNGLVTRNVARIVDAEPVLKHDVLQHLQLKILVSSTEQPLCTMHLSMKTGSIGRRPDRQSFLSDLPPCATR